MGEYGRISGARTLHQLENTALHMYIAQQGTSGVESYLELSKQAYF